MHYRYCYHCYADAANGNIAIAVALIIINLSVMMVIRMSMKAPIVFPIVIIRVVSVDV